MESTQECINWCKRGLRKRIQVPLQTKPDEILRDWTFRVLMPGIDKSETACVTGDAENLGFWKSSGVLTLKKEDNTNYWSATTKIPTSTDVSYRYCVCIVTPNPRTVIVRKWETKFMPRIIKTNATTPTVDNFGDYDGVKLVQDGWLPAGRVFQFRIQENSVSIKDKDAMKIKLNPVFSTFECVNNGTHFDGTKEADYLITEVANENAADPQFKPQEETGHAYTKEDYLVFNVTVPNNEVNLFTIDFYENNAIFGSCSILESALNNSKGKLQLTVMCSTTHRSIGSLDITYLVIRSMTEYTCNMKLSYAKYWKNTWKGLEVGHRGMGSSFKVKEDNILRENTIASFRKAGESGADMVEFDVQLSKDNVPVIYHDFHMCLISKLKNGEDNPEMIKLPMQTLTRHKLEEMRVYHVAESEKGIFTFVEDKPRPFPLLADLFENIDYFVGFNIEIKWPLTKITGETELEHTKDLNLYLDKILEVVLNFGGDRKIFFSCFDPDVCTALKFKQNLYPVMFLTEGATISVPVDDTRCNSLPAAVKFALNANILGVVSHSIDLLKDPSLIDLVKNAGLKHFCWGSDNNNKDVINKLKAAGLEGIIFDKIDKFSTKPQIYNIFRKETEIGL